MHIVVPFPAGGAFDLTARVLAQRMQAGFVVASATPASAVARLNAEIVRVLKLPEVRDTVRAESIETSSMGRVEPAP